MIEYSAHSSGQVSMNVCSKCCQGKQAASLQPIAFSMRDKTRCRSSTNQVWSSSGLATVQHQHEQPCVMQEEGAEKIRGHPRVPEGTVRRVDDTRKRARERQADRRKLQQEQHADEVKRLKRLRRQEVQDKYVWRWPVLQQFFVWHGVESIQMRRLVRSCHV